MTRIAGALRRTLLCSGLFILCCAGTACGSRTSIDLAAYEEEDASSATDAKSDAKIDAKTDGQTDAKPDVQYDVYPDSKDCNPTKCPTGCCDSTGKCQAGTAAQACGSGGYVCVNCAAMGASCDATKHVCTEPLPCSASTCPNGCCADAYQCVEGTSATQCGKGGEVCKNCQAQGALCSASTHSCSTTPKCGPGTCSGCCDNSDTCRTGFEASACGINGQACQNCSASGMTCNGGTHTCQGTACNPSNCPYGCCDGATGQCMKGIENGACGSSGQTCQACSPSQTCQPSGSGGICQNTTGCSPATCPNGCCDYSTYPPACRPGTDPWQCGFGGQSCQYCAGTGQQCEWVPGGGGQCISTSVCDPSTCPWGCCDPNSYPMQCVTGLDYWACGGGGEVCHTCQSGQVCEAAWNGGICTYASDCGPSNCATGCCDTSTYPTTCVWGGDPWYCGNSGQKCQNCTGPQEVCSPGPSGGTCTAVGSCNASTCPWGCCDPNSWPMACVSGLDPYACGSNGQVCQDCSGPNETCQGTWSGGMCITSQTCSPMNCPGCCDYSQYPVACVGGMDPWSCGWGGQACQACSPEQKCDMGTCIGPQDCGPWNCSGCCDYNQYPPVCMGGWDNYACGVGGQICNMCDYSQKCINGVCTGSTLCGPGNCSGCCDQYSYPPLCLPGMDQFSCGSGGETCYACGPGGKCVATPWGGGICQGGNDCGPWNCTGCCDYNYYPVVCQPGSSADSCGLGGGACQYCPVGYSCQNGSCTPAPLCGPGNCSGCCDNSVYPPKCQTGFDPKACGSGGQACKACGAGESCVLGDGGGGTCQGGVPCGPTSCLGCCDWNGVCQSGDTNTNCGVKGLQCTNCLITGQICDQANGACVSVPNCGPWNCAGCCTNSGNCEPGYSNNRCGHGGVLCENCNNSGATCVSGSCTGGSASNCPATYPGCAPTESNPAAPQILNSCSPLDLKNAANACTGDPTPPSCSAWFSQLQQTNPSCYKCLLPLTGPKAVGSCLLPYLDPGCDHNLACSLDCNQVACGQCDDNSKDLCEQNIWTGTCAGYIQGLYCAQTALQGPGAFCAPTGDYGQWIYTAGNHYCGTGTP